MSQDQQVNRRGFLGSSLASVGTAGAAVGAMQASNSASGAEVPAPLDPQQITSEEMPYGMIGKAKISRLLLGGNLVTGYMHARDLKYVNQLFRAYATEEKMMETLRLAEANGVNTLFETGAHFVQRYNREYGGKMQFIPHIQVGLGQDEQTLKDHIQRQVDSGAVAVYIWGVAADRLVQAGAIAQLAKAVELAKQHDLPVGVGSHSLLVPMQCEEHQVPCDFYVKTLHSDDYPSATPKPLRKEFIWFGGPGFYDNMWCINPEETIEFMKNVTKPWLAFKVLAAGAFFPKQAFPYAFRNGADFIAVGMFDFHIKNNAELVSRVVRREQDRQRPWRA
jgi:hypothetical protein